MRVVILGMTGLVTGSLIYLAVTGSFLALWIYGLWAAGVFYIGLALAAHYDQ